MTMKKNHKSTSAFQSWCLLAIMFIQSASLICEERASSDRPNIILFFLDDSGHGDYAHNGNPTIRTPNITKLSRDGMNFSQFYVTSPACSASRYSLLTGRYPGRSGFHAWVIGPEYPRYLHPKEITIAEGLKDRGYKTGMFGKWHLGTPNKKNGFAEDALPCAHGFDEWLGTNVSHDYNDSMLMKSDPNSKGPYKYYSIIEDRLPSKPKVCASLTEVYTQAAKSFIKKHKKDPFFMYVPYNMPHLGLYASEKFLGKSRRGLLGDVMEEIDDSIGQIRRTIDELGLSKNTLIILSSDNGPWVRFKDTVAHKKYGEARLHIGYAAPFRDGKGSTWEGGLRVPGIFCWPSVIPAGVVEQSPASTLDVLPTLLSLANVQRPKDRSLDGRDISSTLKQDHQKPTAPFHFYYSAVDNKPTAMRYGPWKMHISIHSQTKNNYGFKASRTSPLLFQVEHDIGERFDRSKEQKDIIENMMSKLNRSEEQISEEGSFWNVVE